MKNNNKNERDRKNNLFIQAMSITGRYIKNHYKYLILLFAGYAALSGLNFVKVSTTDSVAGYSIKNYEIGQISDKTIIADRSLPPDEVYATSITEGDIIVKKGFPITEQAYEQLQKMSESPVYLDYSAFAHNEIYLLVISILWYMLFAFMSKGRKLSILEPILEVVFVILVYGVVAFGQKVAILSSPYAICMVLPCVLFTMLATILYGQSSAVILSFITALYVLGASSWEVIPFIYTLITCFVSSVFVAKIERRLDLMSAALVLAIFNMVFMLLLAIVFNQNLRELGTVFIGIAANGFLSGILCLGLLTPLEFMLNTASVFRLMDLSDLNNPLMRRMLVDASGTYQHSMMVAQLAENACREIGANALVARVGAYYHDIGKMDQSEYFVENQQGENKHDDINPTLSFTVIKSHVKKGVEKAHQLHLPNVVVDIIAEHHGNSVVAFFYNKAKEKDPSLSPEDFSYPGNPPSTRESAVVMLADTVEAACKTLKSPTVSSLEKFVNQLVNDKVEHGQMDNCDLTFRDISKIKEAFVQILAGYYHSRIKYPDQKDPETEEKTTAPAEEKKEIKKE